MSPLATGTHKHSSPPCATTGWTRPRVIDGPINGELLDLHIETQLAPTLHKGDVVILDTLATHRSPKAAAILKDIGAWFLFLPTCSPDLNPIEMAFAKLKALIRKAAARTCDQLWKAAGQVCDLCTDEECHTLFKAAGYETECAQYAIVLTRNSLERMDKANLTTVVRFGSPQASVRWTSSRSKISMTSPCRMSS